MIELSSQDRATIKRVLEMDLGHAKDAVLRCEQQFRRMPFDHDNNDILERYRKWQRDTEHAIESMLKLGL